MKTIHPHHNFQWKKNLHYALLIGLLSLAVACQPNHKPDNEEQKAEGGYENYVAETRRAALGDDWERITQANFAQMEGIRLRGDVIAGGLLQGSWYERGGSNVAGRMDATFYYPATEEVYSISQSGTLFKGALTGGTWSVQNDAINFNSRVLGVISASGTKRIIAAKTDQYIYYSDDDGASWTQASGSIVSGASGGGKKLIIFNNGTLFYLQYASGSYYLYRSADNGVSWTTVQTFTSRNDDRVEMFSLYGTNDLYVLDNGTALYSLTGTATSLTAINTSMSLTTNAIYYLSGYSDGTNVTLYVVVNRSGLYKSTDLGTTWTNVSTLPSPPFNNSLLANPFVANTVYYGTIEFKKSADGGATFTSQNTWPDYYTNIDKIHADIGTVTPFTKSDGTKFILLGNDGGIHYFPEPFTTTTNLTTSIKNAEYYDVATIGGVIFAGSQDQGTQRFNGTYGTDIKAATQIIATDYVRLNVTGNGTKLWAEYPNIGTSNYNYYFDNPLTATNATASVNTQSVGNANIQYWVIPTCNWSDPSVNAILMGGGNITGGNTESHLIKLTYNGSSIVRTQYAFDFKANGGSFITAVDHSPADANYMYVGLKNGKFYYSQDAGTSWTQTSGFTGPTGGFSYGSFIHASRVDKNLVFFSGSGGHIYKSTDGGVSFSDMSTGLPNTFVAQMVLNPSETLLFAATDAGPYVCVLSTGQWYSMANSTTPNKAYTAVEYVTGENIVRFSTYGRGVWDFVISSQILPVSYSSFDVKGKDQQAYISWVTVDEQDLTHYEVERSLDGVHFSTIQTVKANNKASQYQLIDKNPQEGINYYRIKSNASTGKAEYTAIKSITIADKGKGIVVYPTLLHRNDPLSISTPEGSYEVVVYDSKGQVLWQQKLTSTVQQVNMPMLSSGVYVYVIQESKGQKVKTGKLMVL